MTELLNKTGTFTVTPEYFNELCETYPNHDIRLELDKAKRWLEDHASRRPKSIPLFLKRTWFPKARPSKNIGRGVSEAQSQHYAVVAERNRTEEPFIPARDETVKRELGRVKQMLGIQ